MYLNLNRKKEFIIGIAVMIMGASGSGKSCGIRNFKSDEVRILNVASKPLPFKNVNKLKVANKANYDMIEGVIKSNQALSYVIDDAQYLMAFESFNKISETGYGKFSVMANNYREMIRCAIEDTSPDTIVYFLQHTEETDSGKIKPKTLGKMLDSQLTVEGLFSIVLMANTDGNNYYFETQSDGATTCKSPMGMFDTKQIDNDLKFVDTTIREYYGLKENNKKEIKEKI